MRSLFKVATLLALVLMVHSAWAQCPVPAFSVPAQICAGQPINLTNTSTGGNTYRWNFCGGTLTTTPSARDMAGIPITGTPTARYSATAKDGANYYTFVVGNDNRVYRVNHGTDVTQVQSIESLGNPNGLFTRPFSIDLVNDGSGWFGLLVNQIDNKIIRVRFGSSLGAAPSSLTADSVSIAPDQYRDSRGIKIVQTGSTYAALIPSITSNRISIVKFGNSVGGPVLTAFSIPGPSNGSLEELSVVEECGNYYAVVLSSSFTLNRQVIIANLGRDLETFPIWTQGFNFGRVDYPIGLNLVRHGGSVQGIVTMQTGAVYHLAFPRGITTLGESRLLGTYPNLFNARNPELVEIEANKWAVLGTSLSTANARLGRLLFQDSCFASATTSSLFNPAPFTFSRPGRYAIGLDVVSATGQVRSRVDTITVGPAFRSDFTFNRACGSLTTNFTASPIICTNSNIVAWEWNFGDGLGSSAQANPSYTFGRTGFYNVTLRMRNGLGLSEEVTKTILVEDGAGAASFTVPTTLCSGSPLLFQDASTLGIDTARAWSWNFGNGATSIERNPSYSYPAGGNYRVTLTVTGSTGCTYTTFRDIVVNPGIAVSFTQAGQCQFNEVTFTNTSVPAPGVVPQSYTWNFGDGTPLFTTNAATVTHTYTRADTFLVTLEGTANSGCVSQLRQGIRIYAKPVAGFRFPGFNFIGDNTQFTDTSRADRQTITSRTWDFGDPASGANNTSTLTNPVHTYSTPGSYNVQLILETNQGCRDTVVNVFNILQACPTADFNIAVATAAANSPIAQTVNAPGAVRYEQDQCAGDLALVPIATAQILPSVDIRNTTRLAITKDRGRWYGIGVNSSDPAQNTNTVHLYDFGTSVLNTPEVTNQGIFPLMQRPVGMALQRTATNFVVWTLNLGGTFVKTTLPDSIGTSTTPVQTQQINLPAPVRNPIKLVMVEDKDSTFFFALSRDGTNANLTRIAFGPDLLTPTVTVFNNPPDLQRSQGLRALALVKDCNRWYGVLAGAGLFYRLDFGYSLNNTPAVGNITNSFTASGLPVAALANTNEVVLSQEGGRNWCFLLNDAGNLVRSEFRQGLSGLPSRITNLGNLTLLSGTAWMTLVQDGSDYIAFSSATTTSTLFRIRFPNRCSAQVPFFNSTTAQTVPMQYSRGGTYRTTIKVTDQYGFITYTSDSVLISAPAGNDSTLCTSGTFSITNANKETCRNNPVNLSSTLAAPAEMEIDACAGELAGAANTMTASPAWFDIPTIFSPRAMDMIRDGSRYVGIIGGLGNVFRFSTDSALNTPALDQSGVFPGVSIGGSTQVTAIKMFKRNGEYYAFGATPTNLFLLELGPNPLNTTISPRYRSYSGGGNLQGARFLEVIQDRTGIYVVVASNANNNLVVYEFGNSINNFPEQRTITIPGVASISGMSMLRDCGTWHALMASDASRTLLMASFGKGMAFDPSFRTLSVAPTGVAVPVYTQLAYDGGNFYAFTVTRQPNNATVINRYNFGGSLYNTPSAPTNLGNFGGLPNLISGLFMHKALNSQWSAFVLSENRTTFRLAIGQPCDVARPIFTSVSRPDLTYNSQGGFKIDLTATDSLTGAVARFSDSVTIRNPVDPNFGAAGQLCRGGQVQFTDLSIRNVPTQISYFWNFGDTPDPSTIQSQLQNPTYNFNAAGVYTVRLRTVESTGCSDVITRQIRIRNKLVPAFTPPVPSCSYDSITLRDLTPAQGDTIAGRFWTVFDGGGLPVATASGATGRFSLTTAGNYTVTLRVVSISGCDTTSAPVPLLINSQGTGFRLSVDSSTNCFGDSTVIRIAPNPGEPNFISFRWTLSNGQVFTTPGTQLSAKVFFGTSGNYFVTVQGENTARCNSTITQRLQIFVKPSATIDFTQPCEGAPVTFRTPNISVDGTIVARKWFFGDGASDTSGNTVSPVHTYATVGSYQVRLVLVSSGGCSDTSFATVNVTQAPQANFTHVPACAGDFTAFTDQSSTNGLGSITSYFWDFGDGSTSVLANPRHQYLNGGRFNVTLTVVAGSCPNTIVLPVEIPGLPVVGVTVTEGCKGQPYIFRDNTIYTGNPATPQRRVWTINGQSFSGETVNYLPDVSAANIDATLEVTTQAGCTSSRSVSLVVQDNSVANFRILDSVFTAGQPLTVRFQNLSTGAQRFKWSFGNGDTSAVFGPSYTYASPGVYTVCLTAFRNSLCSTEICRVITIQPNRRPDVAVTNVLTTQTGNQLSITAQVANRGNVDVRAMNLAAQLNGTVTVQERWTGSILPGATQLITLRATVNTDRSVTQNIVCLEADLVGEDDINPDDNAGCTNASRLFSVLSTAPNPSSGLPVSITYAVPREGQVVLELTDVAGRSLQKLVEAKQTEGVYTVQLQANQYANGLYYIRARFEDERQQQRLVITR